MGQYDYSQNDPQWLDMPLGFSGIYFMGIHNGNHSVAAGCYVTSLAMAASYLGHVISPADMNTVLKQNNLIDNQGDIIYNDTLNRLFPDIQYIERRDWPTQPAPLDYFDVRNDVSTEIIVLIDDSPSPGLQQHWLRVVGWNGGSDIIVVDPWDGVRKGLSAYANRNGSTVPKIIYAAVKYHRAMASVPVPPITNSNPEPSVPSTPPVPVDPVVSTSPLPVPAPEEPSTPPVVSPSGPAVGSPNGVNSSPAATPAKAQSTSKSPNWPRILRALLRLLNLRSKKKP